MKKNWWWIIPISVWLLVGIYGIYYNITYIDEAKYLIKGWLMTTGQVGYYSTPEFFYQHMPGGLLWYGSGQKIFGPSLLMARIQSFLIGSLVMFFSYKLAKLINPKAKKNILPILSLGTVAILYYSSAVPQSLAALTLVLAFYWLFKNNFFLTTFWFTLAFIVRENFLFTLIIYIIYLLIYQRKIWLKQVALMAGIICIFFLPGWPGILNILKNFPGVSFLLPIPSEEKAVLGLNWIKAGFSFHQYWQAIKEFGVIYFSFILITFISFVKGIKEKKIWIKDNRWRLLIIITGFNLLAHAWSAAQLTPRSIISYWAYFSPLVAVIVATVWGENKIKYYCVLLLIALFGLNFSSLFQLPNRVNTIKQLNISKKNIQSLVTDKNKIIWLSEPMSLYLAGKISYYPLINHTNFFKPSGDTKTVSLLGFWNYELMKQWLEAADLVVIDNNRLDFLSQSPEGNEVKEMLTDKLQVNYREINPGVDIWPKNLKFYQPLN